MRSSLLAATWSGEPMRSARRKWKFPTNAATVAIMLTSASAFPMQSRLEQSTIQREFPYSSFLAQESMHHVDASHMLAVLVAMSIEEAFTPWRQWPLALLNQKSRPAFLKRHLSDYSRWA
jgi:hypothetical protein